jgi:redox-sensing transcriptional repressor
MGVTRRMPMRPTLNLQSSDDDAAEGTSDVTALPGMRATAAAVPAATAGRLPGYLHALHGLATQGASTVSSHALATRIGVSPAKLRKDLSYLGSFGTRGVGYDVGYLIHAISETLGVADDWEVAIAGVGNLGRALARYEGFASRGLRVSVLFDVDPALVGGDVGGVPVHHIDHAPAVVGAAGIVIGVVAVPIGAAQLAADRLVAGGVTSLLSFAAAPLAVPAHVNVRHVDLSSELQLLGFHEFHRRRGSRVALGAPAGPETLPPAAGPVPTDRRPSSAVAGAAHGGPA